MEKTMFRLKYYIIIGLLHMLALLPFRMLYVLSDFICLILYRIVRYRRKVVRRNLGNSFPEKTPAELRQIERRFYSYLCDCIVETVKLLHISDSELTRRAEIRNADIVNEIASKGHPMVLFMGHYGNWEWVQTASMVLRKPLVMGGIYHPAKNKVMDRVMQRIRSRFDTLCIPMKSTYRTLMKLKDEGTPFLIGFISDQRPAGTIHDSHWTDFMHQSTPYLTGGETIGNRIGAKFLYMDVERVRRGYYTMTFRTMEIPQGDTSEYPYTLQFLKLLEQSIRRAPEYWLWSHNRWKHRR